MKNEPLDDQNLEAWLREPAPLIADDGFSDGVVAAIRRAPRLAAPRPDWIAAFVRGVPWSFVAAALSAAVVLAFDLDWPADAAVLLFLAGGCVLLHTHNSSREFAVLVSPQRSWLTEVFAAEDARASRRDRRENDAKLGRVPPPV